MKVQLEGVAETLLIPLWARAHETQKNKNRLSRIFRVILL